MMNELVLKGKILGFEEYEEYTLRNAIADHSPFRLLECQEASFSFVVVNPYDVTENYTFEIEDQILADLGLTADKLENLAVLCIVRHHEEGLLVNLRSPLIFNTERGLFRQVILDNEAYSVSTILGKKSK